jgi:ParB-like chromosome segregation protein Spo0J
VSAGGITLKVGYRPLSEIREYPNNARRHSAAQITAIKRSLGEFGWTAPMLIADDQLIAGHARHRAALQILSEGGTIPGVPDVSVGPMIDLSHLPPSKRRAYVLADNRLAELAGWDTELLVSELQALSDEGMDTLLVGYSQDEFATLLHGWETDFPQLDRIQPEATDQLGVVVVRCRREQVIPVVTLIKEALADAEGLENVRIDGHSV